MIRTAACLVTAALLATVFLATERAAAESAARTAAEPAWTPGEAATGSAWTPGEAATGSAWTPGEAATRANGEAAARVAATGPAPASGLPAAAAEPHRQAHPAAASEHPTGCPLMAAGPAEAPAGPAHDHGTAAAEQHAHPAGAEHPAGHSMAAAAPTASAPAGPAQNHGTATGSRHHHPHPASEEHPADPSMTTEAAPVPPRQIGQSTFAALAEMAALLEADPATDWSAVRLDALREHLVDMDQVMTAAVVETRVVPGGFAAEVSGEGRTLAAIRRMVPAHARFMNGRDGLAVEAAELESGVRLTVTTADPSRTARLRGLGFFGFLTRGDHHLHHHLAMARGSGHP